MNDVKGRRRVLIVEDEPALRLSYERHFKPRYDLIFASTGAEALARLAEVRPDVAVPAGDALPTALRLAREAIQR